MNTFIFTLYSHSTPLEEGTRPRIVPSNFGSWSMALRPCTFQCSPLKGDSELGEKGFWPSKSSRLLSFQRVYKDRSSCYSRQRPNRTLVSWATWAWSALGGNRCSPTQWVDSRCPSQPTTAGVEFAGKLKDLFIDDLKKWILCHIQPPSGVQLCDSHCPRARFGARSWSGRACSPCMFHVSDSTSRLSRLRL